MRRLVTVGAATCLLLSSVLCAAAEPPAARTLVVPDQFRTIRQAIEAAKAGDTVQVKPGVYAEALVFKDGIRLVGTDRTKCFIEPPGNVNALLHATKCAKGLVADLTFRGHADTGKETLSAALRLDDSSLEVRGCIVENLPGNGIWVKGETSTPTLKDITCRNNGGSGMLFADGAAGTVADSTCDANGHSGISVRSPHAAVSFLRNRCRKNKLMGIGAVGDVTAEGNVCSENQFGISISGKGAKATLRRNTCSNNQFIGLSVGKGIAALIEGNTASGNGTSGMSIHGAGTVAHVTKNTCSGNTHYGIRFSKAAGGTATGNVCHRNGQNGLSADGANTCPVFKANQCNDNRGWGIYYTNDAAPRIAADNKASGNKTGDIHTGPATVVAAPTETKAPAAQGTDGAGLALVPSVAGGRTLVVPDQFPTIQKAVAAAKAGDTVQVKPGTYRESITFKDGIHLVGTDPEKCRIEAADGAMAAILVKQCKTGRIDSLTLDGRGVKAGKNNPMGIEIKDACVLVRQCRIVNFNGLGIFVLGKASAPVLQKNECRDGKWCGIAIAPGARAVVEDNACTKNRESGIMILGGKVSLKRNACGHNGVHGIVFGKAAAGVAEGNTCEGNQADGISVRDKGTNANVLGNTCRSNRVQGISIRDGATATVEGNTCEDSGDSGILVLGAGTAPKVAKNTCRNNKNYGVYFGKGTAGVASYNTCERNTNGIGSSGASPALAGNKCLNNTSAGIVAIQGATGSIAGNRCFSNKTAGIALYHAKTAPTLKANLCSLNGSGVLFKLGAGGTATQNQCTQNKACGIAVVSAGTAPTLESNTCFANAMHGIFFGAGTRGAATGNTCQGNKADGIAVNGKGATPTLKGNKCLANAGWGINQWGDASPTIAPDNTATGNKRGQIRRRDPD